MLLPPLCLPFCYTKRQSTTLWHFEISIINYLSRLQLSQNTIPLCQAMIFPFWHNKMAYIVRPIPWLCQFYNHYNQYYAQDYPTLTKLIENESEYPFSGEYQKAVSHLKSFGLNEGNEFNWAAIGQALTDPNAALNFPVKFPAIGLDQVTRNTITGAASIIAAGWIAAALIKK